jgi:hypothetical protein
MKNIESAQNDFFSSFLYYLHELENSEILPIKMEQI